MIDGADFAARGQDNGRGDGQDAKAVGQAAVGDGVNRYDMHWRFGS
jgi:hypothetical protein